VAVDLWSRVRRALGMALQSGVPVFAVVLAQVSGIDFGPLNKLMDALGCGLRTFGPYLAFLFFVIGAVLVVASSSHGTRYIAYGLFGLAVVAAAPKVIAAVGGMFSLGLSLTCQ